jgi:hypothetical protein
MVHARVALARMRGSPGTASCLFSPQALAQRALVVQEGGLEPEVVVKHGVQDGPVCGWSVGWVGCWVRGCVERGLKPCQQGKLSDGECRMDPIAVPPPNAPTPSPPPAHQYRFHSSVLVSSRWRRSPGTGMLRASTPCSGGAAGRGQGWVWAAQRRKKGQPAAMAMMGMEGGEEGGGGGGGRRARRRKGTREHRFP